MWMKRRLQLQAFIKARLIISVQRSVKRNLKASLRNISLKKRNKPGMKGMMSTPEAEEEKEETQEEEVPKTDPHGH